MKYVYLELWWILYITVDKIANNGTFMGKKWQDKSEYFKPNKIEETYSSSVACT